MIKKYLLALAATSCLIACSDNAGIPSTNKTVTAAERNLAAARGINAAIETGDTSHLGEYIAADAVDHSDMQGDAKGLDKIKKGLSQVHKLASGDMKLEIKKEVADSDYVFQWIHLTGTAASTEMGVPIGKKFELNTIGVSRYKDGKATDYWEFMQPADMMKLMSPPADHR